MTILGLILVVAAYLLGSLSSAVIVSRLFGLPDPRTQGSGNPGATNVLRLGSKKAAAIVLLGDLLKGLLAVLIARALTADETILAAVGLAAVLGHLYPVFFGFRGGKGVATALGVLSGLTWPVALCALGTWLGIFAAFRISSLAALSAAVLAPLYAWWLVPSPVYVGLVIVISLLLLWRHRSNIQKLLQGSEGQIGPKAS